MRWIVAVAVALFVIDRLLLAAERKGWVYYRHRKPTSGSASAAAFGSVSELFRPSEQIMVEQARRQRTARRTDAAGEGTSVD